MCSELVSAIMAVRNGVPFIQRTLESVLAQRYRELEVIVADDGSTDETVAIVEDMARHDGRLRLFSVTHGGAPRARNFAIANARGSLIAPVDADDIWHPEKISRQVEALTGGSPRAGVAYCFNVEIDEDDFVLRRLTESDPPEGWVLPRLIERNFVASASTPLIRRSYLEAAGGYDPDLPQGAEDWKLYLTLAALCEFVCVPAHLVGYRKSTTNMSRNFAAMANSIGLVRQWSMQRWPELPKSHWVRQSYFTNNYLAYQALSQNCLLEALQFEFEALSAMPIALLHGTTFDFILRSIILLVGLNQTIKNARQSYLRVRHRRWGTPDAIK